jgi:hypothetical protein
MKRKVVFTLENRLECLGVYTSMRSLAKGVEYWMNESPKDRLHWKEWELNYILEALSWEWAYIPIGSRVSSIGSGGAMVPLKKYWGHNLVDLSNRGIRFHSHEEDSV